MMGSTMSGPSSFGRRTSFLSISQHTNTIAMCFVNRHSTGSYGNMRDNL